MATNTNDPREDKNKEFGLPQTEFKPLEHGGNKWLKVTIGIVAIVLMVGAGVVYWFFYHAPAAKLSAETQPMHEEYEGEEEEEVEVEAKKADVDFIDDDNSVPPQSDADMANNTEDQTATKPQEGTITKLSTPQGHFYVVLASFIDDDLAEDYAKRLAKEGVNVTIIAPAAGKYFSRVVVEQEDTFYDATEKANEAKATYGPNIWVLKY